MVVASSRSERRAAHREPHGASHSAWPLLSVAIVRAIVEQAHQLDRKVVAHVGEARGVEIALDAGVDEWAHVPCAPIS